MTIRATLLTLVLAAACGPTLASSLDTRSTLAPPDAFDCVMKAFEAEGFKRMSYDKDELRTMARRVNPSLRVSNVQFQKAFDQIDVDVGSGAGGETDVKVTASTVAEYFSQAGQTFETRKPSPEAQDAARKIAAHCEG